MPQQKQKATTPRSGQEREPKSSNDEPRRSPDERRIERHEQAHENVRNPNRTTDAATEPANWKETSHPANKEAPKKPALQGQPRTSTNPSQPAPSIRGNPEAGKAKEQKKRGRH